MTAGSDFASSTIGRKAVMAVTGLILAGFVLGHMVGNLQVYLGPEAMNHYAEFLREVLHGAGLWIARAVLLLSVILHIWAAASLTMQARRARPVGYRQWKASESTFASRTMRWSGVIVALFVVYHLLHFTTGTLHPDFVEGDVYHNFIRGFQSVPASAVYIVAMIVLCLHLRHGFWSLFQTLGVSHPRWMALIRTVGTLLALVILIGNLSFPIAVLMGWLR